MRRSINLLFFICLLAFLGCQTVHDGTEKAGTYVGKGVDAAGGITEGALEGYTGRDAEDENPYGR